MGIVFPAESDLAIGKVHDTVVGNGDAMRVAGQIVEDMFGPAERSFGVDYPILTEQRSQKSVEGFRFAEGLQASGKEQFPVLEGMLETVDELAAKYAAQHFYRQEEGIARMHPALVIGRETAGGDHAMDMRVMLEGLSPGVEHTQETDLGAEMLGIGGNLHQGRVAGAKQEIVDDLLVLQSHPRQLVGNREDDMDVVHRQQLPAASGEPLVASVGLALWAVPGPA